MILFLVCFCLICLIVFQFVDCEIIITPIKGVMLGALYNDDVYEDETEHTIQVLLFVISFSFVWITNGSTK
jgi:uncharacterized membrane protein